jgi:hypothetical protein
MNSVVCSTLSLPASPHCAKRADSDGCSVLLCAYSTKIRESIHLIHLGARAGFFSQLTNPFSTAIQGTAAHDLWSLWQCPEVRDPTVTEGTSL